MKKLFFVMILFTAIISPSLFALTFRDMSTEEITDKVREWIQTAEGNQTPIIMDGFMLIARENNPRINYRGIAFQHEKFQIVHKFQKNKLGTFVMAYKIPPGKSSIIYRLIQDGLWSADNLNQYKIQDARGFSLSCLPLAQPIQNDLDTPRRDGESVVFRFEGEPKQTVFLTGDFIAWDPYTYKMNEILPGIYEINVKLPVGIHRYYFLKNGAKILDESNPFTDYSRLEGPVSVFEFF